MFQLRFDYLKTIVCLLIVFYITLLCSANSTLNSNTWNDNKPLYNGSSELLRHEVLLSDANNDNSSSATLNSRTSLFTNGSIPSDIKQKVFGKRIPIREIVLQPDGESRGEETPRISGRQLEGITKKAKGRMLSGVPVKNGSLQRDSENKIKIQIKNKTNGDSISVKRFADYMNVTTANIAPAKRDNKFSYSSIKRESNVSADKAYFLPPMPLVSEDCNEMKTNSVKNTSNHSEKDMEFSEREKIPFQKFSNTNTDVQAMFVPSSKSVSHVHSYDKSRRAIDDYKIKLSSPKEESEINRNKIISQVSNKYIPFETEPNYKMESNTLSLNTARNSDISFYQKDEDKDQQDLIQKNSFDYLKKKIYKDYINRTVYEEDTQINIIESESDFKTSKPEKDDNILSPPVIHGSAMRNKDEKWFEWQGRERDRNTVIRFSVRPSREKYVTPTLNLSEGIFIFRFLSGFFTVLHPFAFPTELLRDVMWNTISVPQLILQSIRVEVGFIIIIILAIAFALVVPAYGLCCALLKLIGGISTYDGENQTATSTAMEEDAGPCEKRMCLFLLQLLVLFSLVGVSTMVVSNESASASTYLLQEFLSAARRDIPTYAQATHQSISHVLLHGVDQTISTMEHDLNRADILLGEPVQAAISAETGVDVALDSLADIAKVSNSLSEKVLALGVYGSRAATLAMTANERLRELKRQADSTKRHCSLRDKPLCETADTNSIELVMNFDMLTEQHMDPLAAILNAKNLTQTTNVAKEQFNNIPKAIANQTSDIIEDIRSALYNRRRKLQISERSLTKTALHITAEINRAGRRAENIVRSVEAFEFWRWIVFLCINEVNKLKFVLVAVLLISLVIIIHIVAVSCGCCGIEGYAGGMSKTSVIMMCLFSIPLWFLGIIVFVFGGHGEVYMCRPLYDDPHYTVLGQLLDKPALLYTDGSGFFQELFEELDNITITVPISDVLRKCKDNRPAYPVFHLREILDMNVATAHYNWTVLRGVEERLQQSAPEVATQLYVPRAYEELKLVMQAIHSVNFTHYRLQLNGPLTSKDMNALADQFDSIANQIADLTTSSRIETLASRTRRLYVSSIQPLEQLRTELVFRLTELELQLQPFYRQMNQSLSHLKTIQFYIDNQGTIITEKKVQAYVKRLTGYLEQYRGHVLNELENSIAPCGPLWDIYEAGRSLLCRHYIDSLNGFWFGLTCCLFLWMIATPLSLRLRRACKAARDRKEGLLLRTISNQSSTENAAMSDQNNWSTPGDQDHWR